MRTRFLPKMLNSEAEEYLSQNDIIIVPVGTVEMHGGFPLDSETVISEAYALKMAEACDGLVLSGLPYFYAGATASGRGTVQVSIRQGIDYLSAIAHSLLRQGFKRQIYVSFHGPAHMTCSPMVRDFFDETGVPILYMDLTMQMTRSATDLFQSLDSFHAITVGAYKMLGRLQDVPLTSAYTHQEPQTCAPFNDLFGLAYQSAAIGYCFADPKDHMSTTAVPDEAARDRLAAEGEALIEELVKRMDMPHVVSQMQKLKAYNDAVAAERPWMPSASSGKHS
ncbi:MAG TPA: creatininase family protein [Candidatus Eisenbergiella merdavium]|uniref:Creatininase family protein n=1 Tax=Candidatus Eisenbergiella merdavium TaxID=2838551 RepID=A0A9D2SQP3_9FIRM|nr:creatininase family protein [Candidatus Eisenbergiella merdavium]